MIFIYIIRYIHLDSYSYSFSYSISFSISFDNYLNYDVTSIIPDYFIFSNHTSAAFLFYFIPSAPSQYIIPALNYFIIKFIILKKVEILNYLHV